MEIVSRVARVKTGGGERHELCPGVAEGAGNVPLLEPLQGLRDSIIAIQEPLSDLQPITWTAVCVEDHAVGLRVVLRGELDIRKMGPEVRPDAADDLGVGVMSHR